MPSQINTLVKDELTAAFREMEHAVLVDYTGMSAQQSDELRTMVGRQGAEMLIVKNTLARLALNALHLDDVAELITGPVALVHGGDDPVVLTKAVMDWSKKEKVLKVRGGMLAGKALTAADMSALAALPSIDMLRAQVVSAIASPLTGFVGALQGVLRNVVGVLKAIAEKDED
jgi:large subunit ribosomal protein L10